MHAPTLEMDAGERCPPLRRGGKGLDFHVLGPDDAPWLVVCHGMALSHRDLKPVASSLAERWRVLLWDMPGHGSSLPRPMTYTLAGMTDALEAVLEAAGVKHPVLLGFSFGGMVAQSWMRRHPGRAAGLIAYGCLAPFSQSAPVPHALAGIVSRLTYGAKSWQAIRRSFARACCVTEQGRRLVRDAMAPVGKAGFIAMATALLRAFEADREFRIDCPLLIVRGELDSNAVLLDHADTALRGLSPGAVSAVVPDAGHCVHLDRPDALIEVLLPFLASLPRLVSA